MLSCVPSCLGSWREFDPFCTSARWHFSPMMAGSALQCFCGGLSAVSLAFSAHVNAHPSPPCLTLDIVVLEKLHGLFCPGTVSFSVAWTHVGNPGWILSSGSFLDLVFFLWNLVVPLHLPSVFFQPQIPCLAVRARLQSPLQQREKD